MILSTFQIFFQKTEVKEAVTACRDLANMLQIFCVKKRGTGFFMCQMLTVPLVYILFYGSMSQIELKFKRGLLIANILQQFSLFLE
jgi:hypothetical protein